MWREHLLAIPDGQLLWCEQGTGAPVIFLHGGPGDEHRYLRPLAESFISHFRCILYDQRGSGESRLKRLDDETLHPHRFVEDLELLRAELQAGKFILVGHSWGALLALLYATNFPNHVSHLILLGLGPLTDEMSDVARANRLKCLSSEERAEYIRLNAERDDAIRFGDLSRLEVIQRRRALLGFRGTLYNQDLLEQFVTQWLEAEPFRNWRVNLTVNRLLDRKTLWQELAHMPVPTLVLYGYQDFEPITQAYLLKEQMTNVRVHFINQCGHNPWLEQTQATYQAIFDFATDDTI